MVKSTKYIEFEKEVYDSVDYAYKYYLSDLKMKEDGAYQRGDLYHFVPPFLGAVTSVERIDRILEVGGGTGRYIDHSKNKEYVNFDLSLEMLKTAKKRNATNLIGLVQGDVSALPFKKESFSFIFSIGVIAEHVPLNINIVNQILGVLKKDGFLLFTAVSAFHRLKSVLKRKCLEFIAVISWSKEQKMQHLKKIGFGGFTSFRIWIKILCKIKRIKVYKLLLLPDKYPHWLCICKKFDMS